MAFIRTADILKEINLLFDERDFELRAGKKRRKDHYRLQPVFNVNGTVTLVASHISGAATYLTFSGDGVVELWPRRSAFLIDQEKYEPVEIRRQFRNMLEKDYGFEFKNGGRYALAREAQSFMLLNPRTIPQIFKVFQESDFDLRMCDCNIPTRSNCANRLEAIPLPDGQMCITVGVENLAHEHSIAGKVIVLFDGSDTVSIGDLDDIHCREYLRDPDKLHTASIDKARQVLMEQYGVSFDPQWHMNEAPVFDFCGIPYDPDYWFQTDGMDLIEIEDSDKKLVHGYFLAERTLHKIAPDVTVLDADEEFHDLLIPGEFCITKDE